MKLLINVKPMVIKKGLGYINKDKNPFSGKTMFVKGKDKPYNQAVSPENPSLCMHCKKTKHISISATLNS